jgi:hypothetical protein
MTLNKDLVRYQLWKTVEAVLGQGYRSAWTFLDGRTVLKATKREIRKKRARHTEILLTIGRPNYREKEVLAGLKKRRVDPTIGIRTVESKKRK